MLSGEGTAGSATRNATRFKVANPRTIKRICMERSLGRRCEMFSYLRLLPPPWIAAEHVYKQWLNASYLWLLNRRRTSFLLRSPLRYSSGCTLGRTLGEDFCTSSPSQSVWERPEHVASSALVNICAALMYVLLSPIVLALPPCTANHCRQYRAKHRTLLSHAYRN